MGIPQRFEAHYRVRFDEADAQGSLRPSGLLRYAQDCAWQHSEAAGFDRDWYAARGMHWLVRCVGLRIEDRVPYGETVHVSTEVTGWRRVWARRQARFERADGSLVGVAEIDWVLLTAEGRPAKVPQEIVVHFAPQASFTPARLKLPATPSTAVVTEAQVRPADIDPMGHVNNAAYLDLAEGSAPDPGEQSAAQLYRLEYIRPALPGSRLRVAWWPQDGDAMACRVDDRNGDELFRALVTR